MLTSMRRRETNMPIFHGDVSTGFFPTLFFTCISLSYAKYEKPGASVGVLKIEYFLSFWDFASIMPGGAIRQSSALIRCYEEFRRKRKEGAQQCAHTTSRFAHAQAISRKGAIGSFRGTAASFPSPALAGQDRRGAPTVAAERNAGETLSPALANEGRVERRHTVLE